MSLWKIPEKAQSNFFNKCFVPKKFRKNVCQISKDFVFSVSKKSRKKAQSNFFKECFVPKKFRKNACQIFRDCVFCVSKKSRKKLRQISKKNFFVLRKMFVICLKTVCFVSLKIPEKKLKKTFLCPKKSGKTSVNNV